LTKEEYLFNPSWASSLSYWRTCNYKMPDNMKDVREDEFSEELLLEFNDEPYFKLTHDLQVVDDYEIPSNYEFINCSSEDYSKHIRSCYPDEFISVEDLEEYKKGPLYDGDLWLCLYDKEREEILATGIAELDPDIKEGYLDWIQVSKAYRRRGLGRVIVLELLRRLHKKADFATVSGRVKNDSKPEVLYEACGFKDKVIWHILTKK